jgi:hypothetical protein
VFCLQLFEWIVMLNVIRHQHNKRVEEITYQLNNNRNNNGKKLKFRRDEKILRVVFVLLQAGMLVV